MSLMNKSFDYRRGYRDGLQARPPHRHQSAAYINGYGCGQLKRVREDERFQQVFAECGDRVRYGRGRI